MKKHPKQKPFNVAVALGMSIQSLYKYRSQIKKLEAKEHEKNWINIINKSKELPITMVETDSVNNPLHYKVGGVETIDFIEAKGLNYNLGNVVKYVTRADHKGNKEEDLKKARWYLDREIMKQHI
jgi:uncharacterized ubiquitin-like protein YukD